jgi:2-oxoglutarate ferredoxin oxidoreductase subunit gamma
MTYTIIISGFGGQGILAAGKLLANTALMEGKNVSWLPSYGPEKRGGTSNCHVIISDEPVGSPFITSPNTVIAMSKPAFDKYEKIIVPGGLLIVDTLAVSKESVRKDIQIVEVTATQSTVEMGMPKMANMMLIGTLLGKTKVLREEFIEKSICEMLPEDKQHLIPYELKLLKIGMEYGA